jgi:hypothetical protein
MNDNVSTCMQSVKRGVCSIMIEDIRRVKVKLSRASRREPNLSEVRHKERARAACREIVGYGYGERDSICLQF